VTWRFAQLNYEEKLRVAFIIDMGVDWSGMIRVFVEDTREKLVEKIMHDLAEKVFNVGSREEYVRIHTDFCDWGTRNIDQAERIRNKKVIVEKAKASYGQIAKTLDVTLKVAVYYCHLPDCEQSRRICQWLNAVVDTDMMGKLQEAFPDTTPPLPTSIKKVDKIAYDKIQSLVRESIKREHNNAITPPQWEDIHWAEATTTRAKWFSSLLPNS
jgi:hypothetical protein